MYGPSRIICIPIEESAGSREAIDWTLTNIANPADTLILLNVRDNLLQNAFGLAYGVGPAFYYSQSDREDDIYELGNREYSYSLLRKQIAYIKNRGFDAYGVALQGEIKTELLWKINKIAPEMVIVNHQIRNGIDKVSHESIAVYLAKNLRFPVVVTGSKNNDYDNWHLKS